MRGRHLPLEGASSQTLDLNPEQFRTLGYDVVDQLADLIESLPRRPVAPSLSRQEIEKRLLDVTGADLPETGTPAGQILSQAVAMLGSYTRLNGHPGFMGQIVSPGAPAAALCDLIAGVVNPNVALWSAAPIAAEIEKQATSWIASLVGFPTSCGGLFVSGGTMANIVGLVTARRRWEREFNGDSDFRVYASQATHGWLEKAQILCGIPVANIVRLPTDSMRRMRADALEERLQAEPTQSRGSVLVATAGEVMLGSVDPMGQLLALCKRYGLWCHVDGAYGAPAAAVVDDPDLRAISEADSLAVDAHKWLHAPLEAGCLLVRDPLALPSAFDQAPWYADREKAFSEPTLDYLRMGPQTSRAFRALKVWFLLRNLGRQGYITRIQEDIALSQELFEKVDQHPRLEAISRQLCIAAFRYVPPDSGSQTHSADYLNRLNAEILYELQRGGEIYLSNANHEGAYLLRACTMNFRTRHTDVARIPELVSSVGESVYRRITPASHSSPPLGKG